MTVFRVCSHGNSAAARPTSASVRGRSGGCTEQAPDRAKQQNRRQPVGEDGVGVGHDGHRQRDRTPPEPGRLRVFGGLPSQAPHEASPKRTHHEEEDGRGPVAADGVRRRDDGRQPRRVHRVDVPVLAPLEEVRFQLAVVVLEVVAPLVVVVDAHVAVVQETLHNHEVVGFVTGGQPTGRSPPRAGEHENSERAGQPGRGPRCGDEPAARPPAT